MDELTDPYVGPDPATVNGTGPGANGSDVASTSSLPRPAQLTTAIEADGRWDAVSARLDGVAHRLSPGAVGGALRGEGLGHALHPVLTDLPIGCWTSAALVDLVGGRAGRPVARRLVGLGLLAAVPASLSGMAEYAEIGEASVSRVGAAHASANAAAWSCFALSWRARRHDRWVRGVAWTFAGSGLLAASGYLGGHLAYARGVGVRPPASDSTASPATDVRDTSADAAADPFADMVSHTSTESAPGPLPAAPHLDRTAAALHLGVPPEQIALLVDEGVLLSHLDPEGEQCFTFEDVESVRLLGG